MPDTIKRETDTLVRWVGPYKKSAGTVLDAAAVTAGLGTVTLSVYLEDVEMRVVAATTRFAEDVAQGATSAKIPVWALTGAPPTPWLGKNDVVEWRTDDGEIVRKTLLSFNVGSSIYDPAFNYGSFSWGGTATGPAAAGTVVTLIKKGTPYIYETFPVAFKNRALETAAGHTAEIETDNPAVQMTADLIDDEFPPVVYIESHEQGEIAKNQERFYILRLGPLGSETVSPGARIRIKIGDTITMTEYGTPVAGNDDWGWEATIPDLLTQSAVIGKGDTLRLIVTLSGLANFKEVVSTTVKVVEA